MTPERESPGFHLFVQGLGVAMTLAYAVLAIHNVPEVPADVWINPWHLIVAFIVLCFITVFAIFRDGGWLAITAAFVGMLSAIAETLFIDGEMNGLFLVWGTNGMMIGGIVSVVRVIQNRRLRKVRTKLWGRPD